MYALTEGITDSGNPVLIKISTTSPYSYNEIQIPSGDWTDASVVNLGLTDDGTKAYIASGSYVYVINTASNTVVGSPIYAGYNLTQVAVSHDGKYIYVLDQETAPSMSSTPRPTTS